MIEFIVLGEIPGTTLQITFAWFIVMTLLGLGWFDITQRKSEQQPTKGGKKALKTTTK